MKKGEISINLILVVIVTFVSIVLLLGIFSTKLPTFSKKIYCKTFFHIQKSTYFPGSLRADQSYCAGSNALKTYLVVEKDPDAFKTQMIGYLIACYKTADYGNLNNDLICYEVTISPSSAANAGPIVLTEDEVSFMIYENNLCDILPTGDFSFGGDDYECGTEDRLEWNVDEIKADNNYIVEYDSTNNRIIMS